MTQESEIQSLFAETNEINSLNGTHFELNFPAEC